MAKHANAEIRCEQRDRTEAEGIDQDKMALIGSHWGAKWEQIYEILFPGAPIPYPCMSHSDIWDQVWALANRRLDVEFEEPPESSNGASSPTSRSLDEFSQSAVLMLVDAQLRLRLSSEVAPIEDNLRVHIVDIVRRCQSAVAASFLRSEEQPTGIELSTQVTIQGDGPEQHITRAPIVDNTNEATTIASVFYEEPPFVTYGDIGLESSHDSTLSFQAQTNDSDYESRTSSCRCHCHLGIGSSQKLSGNKVLSVRSSNMLKST